MNGPAIDARQVVVEDTGDGPFPAEVHAAGVRFFVDEPIALGGHGCGPAPYDLLCAALGACTLITLKLYAQRHGWALEHVRVSVRHERHPGSPPDRFLREIHLGGDLGPAERGRLMEIAEHCPVHRTLAGGASIETMAAERLTLAAVMEEPK